MSRPLFKPGDRVRIIECQSNPEHVGKESTVVAVMSYGEALRGRFKAITGKNPSPDKLARYTKNNSDWFCVLEGLSFITAYVFPQNTYAENGDQDGAVRTVWVNNISQTKLRKIYPPSTVSFETMITALRQGVPIPEK